jgi:hypothetical protein
MDICLDFVLEGWQKTGGHLLTKDGLIQVNLANECNDLIIDTLPVPLEWNLERFHYLYNMQIIMTGSCLWLESLSSWFISQPSFKVEHEFEG